MGIKEINYHIGNSKSSTNSLNTVSINADEELFRKTTFSSWKFLQCKWRDSSTEPQHCEMSSTPEVNMTNTIFHFKNTDQKCGNVPWLSDFKVIAGKQLLQPVISDRDKPHAVIKLSIIPPLSSNIKPVIHPRIPQHHGP